MLYRIFEIECEHENNQKWGCPTVCGVEIVTWKQMRTIVQYVAKRQ